MPKPVISGGFASPEAVAHIAAQKFVMAVPLYRQEQEWKLQGIWLSRQTMSNWLIRAAEDWLEPVYGILKAKLLKHEVLHAENACGQGGALRSIPEKIFGTISAGRQAGNL